MFAARRLTTGLPRALSQRALFHNTAPAFVQKGDAIPDLDVLVENSPGNKVNLAKEIKGKAVIIGVPAAFSTSLRLVHHTRVLGDDTPEMEGQSLMQSQAPLAPAPTSPDISVTLS